MPLSAAIALIALGAYLIGSLPFGWLVGRWRGIDLFTVGSGNIGATNAARFLGARFGLLVFALDLLKGAAPVALAGRWIDPSNRELAQAVAAAAAFLGHLFPAYLGFRGGKGVATGAGTVLVLAPLPALIAMGTWGLLLFATRYVAIASLGAVVALAVAHMVLAPIGPATGHILAGTAFVILRHRSNIGRLVRGDEHQLGDSLMRQRLLRLLYVLAAGLWFGGAGFFNLVVAPSLNTTYKEVVEHAPSDRTAFQPLGYPESSMELKAQLGSALFGAGVGPIFPIYFAMSATCALVVLVCSLAWRNAEPGRRVHRWRCLAAAVGLATVLTAWPVSMRVAEIRLLRYDPLLEVSRAAKDAFDQWHAVSLSLSLISVLAAGVLLAMAAWMPPTASNR